MSNEWYTPAKYIEAARLVMGGIDLDPASCELANQTVKAARYYTKEQNGLMQPWYGRVWLNPPYSLENKRGSRGLFASSIELFTTKLVDEYKKGNVLQSVALLTSQTDARWFSRMWDYPICFVGFRLKFNGIKVNPKNSLAHTFGSIFVYLGPNESKFVEVFSRFGRIVRAIDTPLAKPRNLELWSQGGVA